MVALRLEGGVVLAGTGRLISEGVEIDRLNYPDEGEALLPNFMVFMIEEEGRCLKDSRVKRC